MSKQSLGRVIHIVIAVAVWLLLTVVATYLVSLQRTADAWYDRPSDMLVVLGVTVLFVAFLTPLAIILPVNAGSQFGAVAVSYAGVGFGTGPRFSAVFGGPPIIVCHSSI